MTTETTEATETATPMLRAVRELAGAFETARRATGDTDSGPREDGESYVRLRDGSPEWVRDAVRDAHGDMFPDDWVFEHASHIADRMLEYIDSDPRGIGDGGAFDDARAEIVDSLVDVYTARLAGWLASHLHRVGYCDAAVEEYGAPEDEDMAKRLMLGQYYELDQIYGALLSALDTRADEIESEDSES